MFRDKTGRSGDSETARPASGRALAFVLDAELAGARQLASAVGRAGAVTRICTDGAALEASLAEVRPALVFIATRGLGEAAVDALFRLAACGYSGPVQLIASDPMAVAGVLVHVGERQGLTMLPVQPRPVSAEALRLILSAHDFAPAAPVAVASGSLDEALDNDWAEFWYQPKIDLARKQLAGVEAFGRVQHPELGTLPPGVFMQGASGAELVRLAQRGLAAALGAATNFSRLGINLRIAVNLPVRALLELPIAAMVREYGPRHDRWPGLLLDVTEAEVLENYDAIRGMAGDLVGCNASLAIDDFGRGRLPPERLRNLPVSELKLDRAFVNGCADDIARSTICRSVIDLAHHFGCTAVAVGIERSADMAALAALGCDLGQGFLFGQAVPEEELVAILVKRAVAPGAARGQPQRRGRWHH